MFFILLVFAAALGLEVIGTIISVIGITRIFGISTLVATLAIMLDAAKLVTVSFAWRWRKQLPFLMKSYALAAVVVTMVITSAGASGFLSGQFQATVVGVKEGEQRISALKEQQVRYQERKKQIDDQIATLSPQTTVNQRLRLMHGFKIEQETLSAKLAAIDKELPELQLAQISAEVKAGPILYVARALNISVEEAVKGVILMIIFVFDPLAIFLIIAGNFLLVQRKSNIQAAVEEPEVQDTASPFIEELYPTPSEPPQEKPAEAVPPFQENTEPIKPSTDLSSKPILPTGLLKPVQVDALVLTSKEPTREQITRSTLGLVPADPATTIDAYQSNNFTRSKALATSKK